MINYFKKMFQYNDWANKQLFEKLNEIKKPPGRAFELLSHIVLTEKTWFDRIKGKYDNVFWKTLSNEDIIAQIKTNMNNWIDFINGMDEETLDLAIRYKNSKGVPCENTVKDIIAHLLNHSNYHRAQINLLLRQNNFEPILIDYIAFKRL